MARRSAQLRIIIQSECEPFLTRPWATDASAGSLGEGLVEVVATAGEPIAPESLLREMRLGGCLHRGWSVAREAEPL